MCNNRKKATLVYTHVHVHVVLTPCNIIHMQNTELFFFQLLMNVLYALQTATKSVRIQLTLSRAPVILDMYWMPMDILATWTAEKHSLKPVAVSRPHSGQYNTLKRTSSVNGS